MVLLSCNFHTAGKKGISGKLFNISKPLSPNLLNEGRNNIDLRGIKDRMHRKLLKAEPNA